MNLLNLTAAATIRESAALDWSAVYACEMLCGEQRAFSPYVTVEVSEYIGELVSCKPVCFLFNR